MVQLTTQFQPGQVPNPRGRPKGSKNASTLIAAAIGKAGPAITQIVIDKALAGDMTALAMVFARIAPPLKARSQAVQFKLDASLSLTDQARQVMQAVADGHLDTETGRQLIDTLGSFATLRVEHDLTARVDEMERFYFNKGIAANAGYAQITESEASK